MTLLRMLDRCRRLKMLGASLTLLNIALYFYVLFNSYRDVHIL